MAAFCEHYENHLARYYAWISGGVELKIKVNQNRETHLVLKQNNDIFWELTHEQKNIYFNTLQPGYGTNGFGNGI